MSDVPAELCIVIPAFQEEDRLPAMLERVAHFSRTAAMSVEVVVVDDGSTDGTACVAEGWREAIPALRLVCLSPNAGKGAAVRAGMLATRARWRAFLDADGSVDPHQLRLLLAVGAPVVIGSVAVDGADVHPQPWYRVLLGKAGNRVIQALVLPGVADSQRGCKLFRGDVADSVFSSCRIDRWGFDVEVLALTRKLGHEPVEVPIRWVHRPGGTISWADYLRTLVEVARIWRRIGRQEPRAPLGDCASPDGRRA